MGKNSRTKPIFLSMERIVTIKPVDELVTVIHSRLRGKHPEACQHNGSNGCCGICGEAVNMFSHPTNFLQTRKLKKWLR